MSNTPGRTREINFFKVNDAFVLVDLPGYGYARDLEGRARRSGGRSSRGICAGRPRCAAWCSCSTCGTSRANDDLQMLDFLAELGVPTIVAADEDRQAARRASCRCACGSSPLQLRLDEEQMIPFSATTNGGATTWPPRWCRSWSSRRGATMPRAHSRARNGRERTVRMLVGSGEWGVYCVRRRTALQSPLTPHSPPPFLEVRAQREPHRPRRARHDVVVAVRGRVVARVEQVLDVELRARLRRAARRTAPPS